MSAYNIFIVDDDPQMCAIMTAWLAKAGHSVESDTAGSTALSKIRSFEPNAILVDLMMAEVDGLELIAELRARPELEDAAILMVSARTDQLWFDRARDAGADDYLTKPLVQSDFIDKVQTAIATKMN